MLALGGSIGPDSERIHPRVSRGNDAERPRIGFRLGVPCPLGHRDRDRATETVSSSYHGHKSMAEAIGDEWGFTWGEKHGTVSPDAPMYTGCVALVGPGYYIIQINGNAMIRASGGMLSSRACRLEIINLKTYAQQ